MKFSEYINEAAKDKGNVLDILKKRLGPKVLASDEFKEDIMSAIGGEEIDRFFKFINRDFSVNTKPIQKEIEKVPDKDKWKTLMKILKKKWG